MSWRGRVRRTLPYVAAAMGGFLVAYLVVAFAVFPVGALPQDDVVPNVVGLGYADAETRLRESGFDAQQAESRFHATAPRLEVLEQRPAAGSRELRGRRVQLTVSGGQEFVVVPSLAGLTRGAAEEALNGSKLDLGDVTEQSSHLPAGQVIESNPTPGSRVTVPTAVHLVVSAGPQNIAVPNVVGQSYEQARSTIAGAGLRVTTVERVASEGGVPGTVIGQRPEAGANVVTGTGVQLVVAREP